MRATSKLRLSPRKSPVHLVRGILDGIAADGAQSDEEIGEVLFISALFSLFSLSSFLSKERQRERERTKERKEGRTHVVILLSLRLTANHLLVGRVILEVVCLGAQCVLQGFFGVGELHYLIKSD